MLRAVIYFCQTTQIRTRKSHKFCGPYVVRLYLGTVPTLCILNVGTVPRLCILNVWTVPTSSPFELVLSQWHPLWWMGRSCRQRAQHRKTLKSSIFVVQKAAAPKNGVEFCQRPIGDIRRSLATSYDVWRRRRFFFWQTKQTKRNEYTKPHIGAASLQKN